MIVTTSTALEGYKVTQHLGIVKGITVRQPEFAGQYCRWLANHFGRKYFHLYRTL